MSVLVEAITVIFRNNTADALLEDGIESIRRNSPNNTFRSDGVLSAVGFMTPQDVEHFVGYLKRAGFRFVENGLSVDIAICDQNRGFTSECVWLRTDVDESGVRYCWAQGSDPGEMAVQEGWKFENSMYTHGSFTANDEPIDHLEFLRTERRLNVYLNKDTGKEVFVGRPFEDKEDIQTERTRALLFATAVKIIYEAMTAEGWMSISVSTEAATFPHIVMRHRNQIGIVFVNLNWNKLAISRFDSAVEDRLTDQSRAMNAIPLVASLDIVGEPDRSMSKISEIEACKSIQFNLRRPYVLHDLSTGSEWNSSNYDLEAEIELSEWEVHDFGIQVVRQTLEKDGQRIEKWDSDLAAPVQIIATINQILTYIVSRTVRYPAVDAEFGVDDLRRAGVLAARNRTVLKTASVSLASTDDPFAPGGINVQPIFRGVGVLPRFEGLKDVAIPVDG
jgi:hypothetical protein